MSKSKNQRQSSSSSRKERQETYTASLHITSGKVKVKKRLSSVKKTKRYSNPNDKHNNSREKRRQQQQQRDEMIQMQMDEYGCGKGTAWETWRRPHSDYLTEKELEECGNNIFKILGHERRVQQTPVTLDETIVPNPSASTSQRKPSTSKPNKPLKRNTTAASTKRVPKTSSSVTPPVIDIDVDCESDVVLLD